MRLRWYWLLIVSLPLAAASPVPGTVDADPGHTVPGFKPHELPFTLPQDEVARDEFRSRYFYAVMLETLPRCEVTEAHRLEIQARFPDRKVFATRFQCDDDPEENITYTNVNADFGFVAVFAGTTLAQAKETLARVRSAGTFPGANLRKMQVVRVSS